MHKLLKSILLSLTIVGPQIADGHGAIEVIVQSGNATPDGNGEFRSFLNPALNNSGQLAFVGLATNTLLRRGDATGVFMASNGSISQLGRAGSAATVTDVFAGFANRIGFSEPLINDAGQVAFTASLNNFSDEGVYLSTMGQLEIVARTGDTLQAVTVNSPDSAVVLLAIEFIANKFGKREFSSFPY